MQSFVTLNFPAPPFFIRVNNKTLLSSLKKRSNSLLIVTEIIEDIDTKDINLKVKDCNRLIPYDPLEVEIHSLQTPN